MRPKKMLTFPDCFRVDNKIAVITGGASGIGLESAKLIAGAGGIPVLVDLSQKKLDQASRQISVTKIRYPGKVTDVSNEKQLENTFQQISKELGSIDILVNCAGVTIRKPATKISKSDWDKVVSINMTGSFLAARHAAKFMIKGKKGGAIVNIASIMGLSGGGIYPNISYQTTKGAIINMTRALAVEWAPSKIRVNAIAPTYVRTPFIKPLLNDAKILKQIKNLTPLRRLAEPKEVANAVLFLVSPGSEMITGHTLAVDGGFLAQ